MAKQLVIVESPTKAKTISRFLGKAFIIKSSNGHVRDLPRSKMGVDIEHDFAPQYVIPTRSRKTVTALKKEAKAADSILFATDEDREGEAISWHLAQLLEVPDEKVKRITFEEITEGAIKKAVVNPRRIDTNLVNAQQARRILDRLLGYELSPFLWKKVAKGLSAGRVQSVALRIIVEREQAILAFKPVEYWLIQGEFDKSDHSEPHITARLFQYKDKRFEKLSLTSKDAGEKVVKDLKDATFAVHKLEQKEMRRWPLPPFTTSTLQQEANRRFGFSTRQTMFLAQTLYEGLPVGDEGPVGLITYMRTDSVNLSEEFLLKAVKFVKDTYGPDYTGSQPRRYTTKQRLAQEAHEAIRPTDVTRTPEKVKPYLDSASYRVYSLIWSRAVASQMTEAVMDQTTIDIKSSSDYIFRATGSVVKFDGYQKVYVTNQKDVVLPKVAANEPLNLLDLKHEQKFTEPPSRFSEAGLVKALEEYGIGRPSTYSPTISTLVERKYVEKERRRLKPTEIGILVTDLLVKHFPQVVDYKFTAQMEEGLDLIAAGKKEWVPLLKDFYTPFKEHLTKKELEISKKELTETATDQVCEKCGKPMVIKMGRFGKFMACSGYPECKNTKQLNGDGTGPEAVELTDEKCPECGKPLQRKVGRFGPFFGCTGYPDCKFIKNIEKSTGVKCSQCGEGDLIEKRSFKGRTFYSCNQYPKCRFALWSKPTGEKCPDCGSLLVYAKKGTIACSSKECKFTKSADEIKTG
ncbi:MAG: type I DNA topoisomerase [Patescibacteria group bacterium]|nr:type I DNA topoisomerase [Patescibacteria group bacterium]